jgi:hypothetical protein
MLGFDLDLGEPSRPARGLVAFRDDRKQRLAVKRDLAGR